MLTTIAGHDNSSGFAALSEPSENVGCSNFPPYSDEGPCESVSSSHGVRPWVRPFVKSFVGGLGRVRRMARHEKTAQNSSGFRVAM
jgi:hypothetical protein